VNAGHGVMVPNCWLRGADCSTVARECAVSAAGVGLVWFDLVWDVGSEVSLIARSLDRLVPLPTYHGACDIALPFVLGAD
jgi:hypothetical protein